MTNMEIVENLQNRASHQHWCDVAGHYYQCSEHCLCICGNPMNSNDHSDCPVELRPCPKHTAEHEARIFEAKFDDGGVPETTFDEPQATVPHCQCGCADIDASQIVGWCLWCDHVYSKWSPVNQDRHFATHCPDAPETLKEAARARLAKRMAGEKHKCVQN